MIASLYQNYWGFTGVIENLLAVRIFHTNDFVGLISLFTVLHLGRIDNILL